MLTDLFRLLYPDLCPGCDVPLPKGDARICPACLLRLPQTDFHLQPENPAERLFFGRFPFVAVVSAFHFSKGGAVQRMLHRIKYGNGHELAEQLAARYGRRLARDAWGDAAPVFVPVPLHPKKLYRRGYNQAYHMAKGLASAFPGSEAVELLDRRDRGDSQTKKGRYARWQNVENSFVPQPRTAGYAGRYLVLTDDVLTTGATLEACARALRNATGEETPIAALTLAFAGAGG